MSARSYVIGLPVVVEVDELGRVSFEVDLSEAPTSLIDDEDAATRYTDAEMMADVARVVRAVESVGVLGCTVDDQGDAR